MKIVLAALLVSVSLSPVAAHVCTAADSESLHSGVIDSGASRATLSFRVQSPKEENPTYVFLAECGRPADGGAFRVTFNGRRERRVCGFYGGVRV